MKPFIPAICLFLVMSVSVFPGNPPVYAAVPAGLPEIEYDRGVISLTTDRIALSDLLGHIAEAADIDIYLVENIPNHIKTVAFDREPLQEVLVTLLNGINFAVIYPGNSSSEGRVFLYNDRQDFHALMNDRITGSAKKGHIEVEVSRSPSARFQKGGHSFRDNAPDSGEFSNASGQLYSPANRALHPGRMQTADGPSADLSGKSGTASYHRSPQEGAPIRESNSAPAEAGPVSRAESGLDTATGSHPDANTLKGSYTKEMFLMHKIQELESYIASGQADEFHRFWTQDQGKSPEKIYNPWNELEYNKKALDRELAN